MAITRQPNTAAGSVGSIVQFKVVSSSESSTYQWQYTTDGETWTDYAGDDATSNVISVTLKNADNGKQFRCLVDEEASDPASVIILSSDYANKLVKGAEMFLSLKGLYEELTSLDNVSHTHSNKAILDNITAAFTTELLTKLNGIAEGATNVTVDSSLVENSTNPVESQVIQTALAGKAAADHTHTYSDVGADAAGAAAAAEAAAKAYADTQIAALVDSAPEALDTLKELAEALGSDGNFATTITNLIAEKADIADFNRLQAKFSNSTSTVTHHADEVKVPAVYYEEGEDGHSSSEIKTPAVMWTEGETETVTNYNTSYSGNAATATAAQTATKATKLYDSTTGNDVAVGSATQGVYFVNGVPTVMTYELNKTVPADAVFTDTLPTVDAAVATGEGNDDAAYNIAIVKDATGGTLNSVVTPVSGKELTYNPVTGELTATSFNGNALKDGSGNTITSTYATKAQALSDITVTNGNTLTLTLANSDSNTITLSDFTGATSSAAGAAGVVPAPATTDVGKFLAADGTWAEIPQQVEVMNNAEFNELLYLAKNA